MDINKQSQNEYSEYLQKLIDRGLWDEYDRASKKMENENKIFNQAGALETGIVVMFFSYLIFIPLIEWAGVRELIIRNYALILGVVAGIIQRYRLKDHREKMHIKHIWLMSDILSKHETK